MFGFTSFGRAFVPAVATAMVLTMGASAHAALAYYTTEASFLAALEPGAPTYTNTFTDQLALHPEPWEGSGMAYTVEGHSTVVFVNGVASTTLANTLMIVTFTSGNVTAVGGYFYNTDFDYNFATGNVSLTVADSTGETNPNASYSPPVKEQSYTGFIAAPGTTLTSLTFHAPGPNLYRTIDDLTVAGIAPAAVPEPTCLALLGLAALGLTRRRRA